MDDLFGGDSVFKQLLEAIPDLALVKGPQSKILWANKAFRDYYGMSNEQLRNLIDSPIVHSELTKTYIEADAKVFESGQVLEIPSEPVMRYDGVVRRFHTVKSPIRGRDGKIVMIIGISRDIEERQHHDHLQHMLNQSEKLAAVGQLAAGIAHEINNPLGVMLGFAEAMKKKLAVGDAGQDPLAAILREGQRCKTLIQRLLAFSRRKMPGMKAEDPQKMLDDALALIDTQVSSRKITIRKKFAKEARSVLMDRTQMQQVALQLCANSLDAMPQGGELTVSSRYAEHSWIFTVRDTGVGIPSADQARIFEPFFTTKDVGQGTGLGLSTSYQIVQDHRGHILFESHPGEGTSFLVELPLSA